MTPQLNTYVLQLRHLSFIVMMLFSVVVGGSFAAFSLPHITFGEPKTGSTNTYATWQRTYPDLTTEHYYTGRMQLLVKEKSFLQNL